jgi:hypothetical protein
VHLRLEVSSDVQDALRDDDDVWGIPRRQLPEDKRLVEMFEPLEGKIGRY